MNSRRKRDLFFVVFFVLFFLCCFPLLIGKFAIFYHFIIYFRLKLNDCSDDKQNLML